MGNMASLDPLCGNVFGDQIVFHAGGPVRKVEWCPRARAPNRQPTSASVRHYVAVTCAPLSPSTGRPLHTLKTEPTLRHLMEHTQQEHPETLLEPETGVIQIWDVGSGSDLCASQGTILKPPAPRMVLELYHPGQQSFDFEWCPFDSPDGSDPVCRLGLLAVACGDGAVRVFPAPHASSVRQSLRVSDCVTLSCCSHHSPSEVVQPREPCLHAWKVSWSPSHPRVAAAAMEGWCQLLFVLF